MMPFRFGPTRRAHLPASVAAALNGAAVTSAGMQPTLDGKELRRTDRLATFLTASKDMQTYRGPTARELDIPTFGPPFRRTGERDESFRSGSLYGLDRVEALRGLAALGDAAFQQAMSAGFDVNRQVQRLVSLQQRLYARLNNPGLWAGTFNASEIALIRGDLDRWNNSTAANWWAPATTATVTRSKEDLEWWMKEGTKVYDDAAAIAAKLNDTSLVSDLRTARQTFLNETQSALIEALRAASAVGTTAITAGGQVIKAGTDAAGGILSSMAFRVVGIGVLALGGLALGIYMIKKSGFKANVAVPGLPVQVGVSGLRRRRRRRTA